MVLTLILDVSAEVNKEQECKIDIKHKALDKTGGERLKISSFL